MQDRQASSAREVPSRSQNRWARAGHIALRILTLLSLLCLVALGCIAFWLHRDPQAMAAHLAKEIQQRTGIQCSLGTVDVVLLPVPSLGIADMRLQTPDMDFSAAYATVRPALWPLLRGQFAPGNVTLLRPMVRQVLRSPQENAGLSPLASAASNRSNITGMTDTTGTTGMTGTLGTSPVSGLPNLDASTFFLALASLVQQIPDFLYGMNLQILHGTLHSELAQGRTLDIDNISTDLQIIAGGLTGSISLGQTLLRTGQDITLSLDAVQLELGGHILRLNQGADASARLDTRLHIPNLVQGLHLQLNATQRSLLGETSPQRALYLNAQGNLIWAGAQGSQREGPALIPLSVQATGKGTQAQAIQWDDIRIALAQDRLRGEAVFTLQENAGKLEPHLSGTLDIPRLSLTQWFGFARQLPPGLQRTLHQIEGHLRFDISPQGLNVPHIEVSAAEGHFMGKGSVPLWTQPVITLDLTAPQLTLGKAFPEAEGQSPAPLLFAHAPLTPEPGSDAAKNMAGPSIDYDINITVNTLTGWQLHMGDVGFRCIPAAWAVETDKEGKKQKTTSAKATTASNDSNVLMTFSAGQLYGGRGEGQLMLHSTALGKTTYGVKASLRNIAMEQLLSRLTNTVKKKAEKTLKKTASSAPSPLAGRLYLDTEFTAQGPTLADFFASQDGSFALQLDNGHVLYDTDKKEKLPFTHMRLDARIRGGESLTYTGQWKFSLDAPRLKATLQLDGPMFFSPKQLPSVQWRKIPGHLMIEADKQLLSEWQWLPPSTTTGSRKLDLSGRFSLHSGERSFAIEDAQASLPDLGGVQMRGQVHGAVPAQGTGGAWFEGAVEGHTPHARTLLRALVPSAADSLPATTLNRAEAKSRIAYKDKELTLHDMRLKVDALTATGKLSGVWKEKPAWKFDLDVDTLDLDTYLPPRKGQGATKQNAKQSAKLAADNGVSHGAGTASPPWQLQWMQQMDIQGQVRIQSLRVRKFTLREARIPIQLRNATLESAQARGDFYGTPLTASFKAERIEKAGTPQGLKLQITAEAQGLNMRSLSEERRMDTLLAGKGSLWITMQGVARSGADIPAALDGSWSLQISEAYTQPRQAKGTASRTQLGEIRTSGSLEKGVLRSDNLTISGASMQARGGGWVNLDKDTLDVKMQVNMYRIPEFPVRFYGNLENPQRSINAGKAIAHTLGNLGSEVVDVIGNVIGGALRILP